MLWTIVLILIVLWALGFAVHIGGGLIHLLLVIALIVAVVRLIQGRPVVSAARPSRPERPAAAETRQSPELARLDIVPETAFGSPSLAGLSPPPRDPEPPAGVPLRELL